jgi:hypothetical protein
MNLRKELEKTNKLYKSIVKTVFDSHDKWKMEQSVKPIVYIRCEECGNGAHDAWLDAAGVTHFDCQYCSKK